MRISDWSSDVCSSDLSDRRGDQAPVLAAVGPMQFEVATHRMATEFSAPIALESLPYQVARIVDPADAAFMNKQVSAEVLTRSRSEARRGGKEGVSTRTSRLAPFR